MKRETFRITFEAKQVGEVVNSKNATAVSKMLHYNQSLGPYWIVTFISSDATLRRVVLFHSLG